MVKKLSFDYLCKSLLDSGLKNGDTIMVQSSLLHIGPIDDIKNRDDTCEFYYRAFREVIGKCGTILVHTPFESYGRFGEVFDTIKSPSSAGIFSEWIRKQDHCIRSIHPIVSIAGIGPLAEEICGAPHFSGFARTSPWGKMLDHNVHLITLGLGLSKGLSFLHFIEAQYGVPYQYNKIFSTPVEKNGKQINGSFTMSVRYLDFNVQYDFASFEEQAIKEGVVFVSNFSRGLLFQKIKAIDAFNLGSRMLTENIFSFLTKTPAFRSGEIPLDGNTGDMYLVYNQPRKSL